MRTVETVDIPVGPGVVEDGIELSDDPGVIPRVNPGACALSGLEKAVAFIERSPAGARAVEFFRKHPREAAFGGGLALTGAGAAYRGYREITHQ